MYTIRVPRPRGIRPRHAVENQWDLLNAIGIATPKPHEAPVEMPIESQAATTVANRLDGAGVVAGVHPVIVVHVSAGNPFRRWPLDSFAALIAELVRGDSMRRVIVMSGPSERDAAAQVIVRARRQLAPVDADHVLDCGHFDLAEVRALVDRAALYIGGDSGPMHIASTSTVPIVGLYGPTLPVRSAPWRSPEWTHEAAEVRDLPCRPCDQRTCVPGDFRCLTWLKAEDVAAAAERALRSRNDQMTR
jgi:ADP-heptose:LPS heptosyltransferase